MQDHTKILFSPLMRAAAIGHLDVVRELLEEGADVNQRGPRGSTALMFAAGGGHLEIVKELVERGADVSVTEEGGWTARRHAEEDQEQEVAAYLREIEGAWFTPFPAATDPAPFALRSK